MENEEDLYIVIIGEDDAEPQIPAPMQIKQEICEENEKCEENEIPVTEMIKNVEEHEKLIDSSDIKQEPEENDELKENDEDRLDSTLDDDEDYIPNIKEESEVMSDDNFYDCDSESSHGKKRGPRSRIKKVTERRSYVREMTKQFPELKDNQDLLIKCLVEIMKKTKPPPLPLDYYHMNGIMFECIKCGAHTESIPAAGRHYQEKHGKRYLRCFACSSSFRSTTNLYKHEKRCEAPDAVVVLKARALMLGRKGRSRPYLPKPSDLEPTNRFECTSCSAVFATKYSLRAHTLLHLGIRPHRCPRCVCAYTSATALSRHLKKHSNERFICDHCQRSFQTKAAIVTHMATHQPFRRYGCTECPKRYSQKAALILHINRQHRGLPPPCACQLCPKRYPRMSILRDHMKKVHGMLIMTRKMFFKKLPTLSDTQLEQAKVVLKKEVEDPKYHIERLW